MPRILLYCLGLLFLLSCKSRKPVLTGEDPVERTDFINSFEELNLPYILGDSSLKKQKTDTILIGMKVFNQFVPDTLLKKDFGKAEKPKIYAMGKVTEKGKETYLLVKAVSGNHQVGYILCFDEDDQYKAGMPFIQSSNDRSVRFEGGLDKRYSIIRNRIRRNKDGQIFYQKNVYAYNTEGLFNLILTESNEPVVNKEIYNPIDTLPGKHKYAGDYVADKRNFISVRDGKSAGRLLFFVHMEKNKASCVGEVRGELHFLKPDLAQYTEAGDPCVLEFKFTKSRVSIRELNGCGNYRGIKCFFEGSYPKKPVPGKKTTKTAKGK